MNEIKIIKSFISHIMNGISVIEFERNKYIIVKNSENIAICPALQTKSKRNRLDCNKTHIQLTKASGGLNRNKKMEKSRYNFDCGD